MKSANLTFCFALAIDEVLSQFGKRYSKAIKEFNEFVRAGVPKDLEGKLSSMKPPSVLGSKGFMDWIKDSYIKRLKYNEEIPEAKQFLQRQVALTDIVQYVMKEFDVKKRDILTSNYAAWNEPKNVAIYLMRRVSGASHPEIADIMGGMKTYAISKAICRFNRKLKTDNGLSKRIDSYVSQLSVVKT